jgi:hypothetical protein
VDALGLPFRPVEFSVVTRVTRRTEVPGGQRRGGTGAPETIGVGSQVRAFEWVPQRV